MSRTIFKLFVASLFGLLSFVSVAEAGSAGFGFNYVCSSSCLLGTSFSMNVSTADAYAPGAPIVVNFDLGGDDYVQNTCPLARFSVDGVAPYSADVLTGCYSGASITAGVSLTGVVVGNAPAIPGSYNLSVSVGSSGYRTPALQRIAYTVAAPTATYMLVAIAGTGGAISPTGITNVASGASQVFTLTPWLGFEIASLTVDGVAQPIAPSYTFTNVTGNHSISATFAPIPTHMITASFGPNGAIAPMGAVSVVAGSNQTFTITPASGYGVATLVVNGVAQPVANSHTFTNVSADQLIRVTFAVTGAAIPPPNPALSCTGAGTANFTWDAVPGAILYEVTLRNTAAISGWTCPAGSGWSPFGGGTLTHCTKQSPANSLALTGLSTAMPTGFDVATFDGVSRMWSAASSAGVKVCGATAASTYTITSSAGANGSISPMGAIAVTQGNSQAFAVAPDAGYSIASLTVDGVSQPVSGSYLFTNVNAVHTINVSFVVTPPVVVPPTATMTPPFYKEIPRRILSILPGGRVQLRLDSPVYAGHVVSSTILGYQDENAVGVVVSVETDRTSGRSKVWRYINFDSGANGWVEGSALRTAASANFVSGSQALIRTNNTNVRAAPGGAVIGTFLQNDATTVVGAPVRSGGRVWWPVTYATATEAWVVQSNLSSVGPAPFPPASTPLVISGVAPGVPTNLVGAYQSGASAVSIGWVASNEGSTTVRYDVYRDKLLVNSGNTTGYIDFTPKQGTTHSYAVVAISEGNMRSEKSVPVAVVIPRATVGLAAGVRIITTSTVMVRNTPSGEVDDVAARGLQGAVISGPVSRGGLQWWNVQYDNGVMGWSAGTYLSPNAGLIAPIAAGNEWTAKQMLVDMHEAEMSKTSFSDLLAKKFAEQAAKQGLTFIDNKLSFTLTTPPSSMSLAYSGCNGKADCNRTLDALTAALVTGPMGQCNLPIPGGTPYNARVGQGVISGTFENNGSFVDFKSSSTQMTIGIGLSLDLKVAADLGLEWCGSVLWPYQCAAYAPNPACPPPLPYPCPKWNNPFKMCVRTFSCPLADVCIVPVPKIKMAKETWTDWTTFKIEGKVVGSAKLALNHSFGITDGRLLLKADAKLTGDITQLPRAFFTPVRNDFGFISTPIGSIPHIPTGPVFQTVVDQINVPLLLIQSAGIDEKFIKKQYQNMLKQQEARINQALNSGVPIEIKIPGFNPNDPSSVALLKQQLTYLRVGLGIFGDVVQDIVKPNFQKIQYYILTDNKAAIKALFTPEAMCPSIEKIKANMSAIPMYQKIGTTCSSINPKIAPTGVYYSDVACLNKVSFQAQNFTQYCKEVFAKTPNLTLGNAASWGVTGVERDPLSTIASPASKWSLSQGAQLDIGVESIKTNNVPYMKRVEYKNVNRCAIEMRIYKKDLGATNLKPLMWIHGGSWQYRGFGFPGLEALVSKYTDEGFVVFAPFYRLTNNKDGTPECNDARWQDMTIDVESALDWVKANSAEFGAPNTGKIQITGQSAGGHLAAWLVTHRPNDVSRAVLLYPPADFNDFAARAKVANGMGFPLLPVLYGTTSSTYSAFEAEDIIRAAFKINDVTNLTTAEQRTADENSFGQIVRTGGPLNFPPVLTIFGASDGVVTYTQGQALCEGYGGTVSVNWTNPTTLRDAFRCGTKSYLHVIKEAYHAFEICLPGLACMSGSQDSANIAADSLRLGRNWLLNEASTPMP